MKTIKEAVQRNHPELYNHCRGFPQEAYTNVYKLGSVEGKDLYSMIHKLKPSSDQPYIFHEIVELAYSTSRKDPPKLYWQTLVKLVEYWNLTNFQGESYTLVEFTDILLHSSEIRLEAYVFGYPPTDPVIVNFIQEISSRALSPIMIENIKKRLAQDPQSVAKALQRGIPYELMAEILLKRCNSWVFNFYPLILEDKNVGRLFLELSSRYDSSIPIESVSKLANIRDLLVKISDLPDKEVAMEKLLLMIYFPEKAQFICNSPSVVLAFKAIIFGKLTKWRREIAIKIDWKSDLLEEVPFFKYRFKFLKDYYDGCRENSMFDDFILMFDGQEYRWRKKEFLVKKKGFKKLLRNYKRRIIEEEPQGTVYSIIKNKYQLNWDPLDPLNEEVNPKFENECINILLNTEYAPNTIWFISKYIDMLSGAPIPISRLMFESSFFAGQLVSESWRNSPKTSTKAMRKIYKLLAKYCQHQKGYLKRWDSNVRDGEFNEVFHEMWERNVHHCNFTKGFEVMTAELEDGQVDFLTKRLLLQILKGVVEMHFPAEVALEMDFTTWTNTLKKQLSATFEGPRKDPDASASLGRRRCRGCIIA